MSAPAGSVLRLQVRERGRSREGDAEIVEIALRVPPDLHWLRGHFEGDPILPAIIQLQEALLHAADRWPDVSRLRQLRNAKFKRPIRPADDVVLRLERRGDEPRIGFRYTKGSDVCSTGVLDFQGAGAPPA